MAENKTKIDIFSGFLGAGKTTLIKKLIQEAFKGEKIVLIENEFGEIGIDGGFMREAGIQVNELNSGCICCSLVGDFREALKKVVETYHPDRILIEPSGVGKLSDVTRAVEGVAETLPVVLNSFVTVADVNKVKMYMKNFGEFYDDQVSHASCIILSRTGNAGEEKIAAAVAMLAEKNPTATIVTTDWTALTGAQIVSVMDGKRDLVAELLAEAKASNEAHADEDVADAGDARDGGIGHRKRCSGDFHDAAHQHHAHGDDQANVVHDVERLEQLVAGEVVLQSEQRGDQEYREPEHQQVRVHKSQCGLPGELREVRELAEEHACRRAGDKVYERGVDQFLHKDPPWSVWSNMNVVHYPRFLFPKGICHQIVINCRFPAGDPRARAVVLPCSSSKSTAEPGDKTRTWCIW